jgi:hypothetical protein
MSDPVADRLDGETGEVVELRAANRKLQRQLAQSKAKTEALVEAVEQAAREAAVTVGRPTIPTPQKDARKRAEEVALIHATDWQCGKRTGTFDSEILATRIGQLAGKVAKLTEIQRADHPVRRCVLMLGGDMVEGVAIFPGQAWEVDSTLYDQLFTAARIVEQLVVDLLAVFERVDVVCEYGNHGRLGRKGDFPGQDNIDLFMYRMVAERLTDQRVSWQFSTDWRQLFQIGEYKALLVHGDEIKSFGGNTPAFGILRKATAWASGVVPEFADVYLGHFHTPMTLTMPNGGQIYVTGSPESDNPYAAEFVAARGRPSQRLHFIDPAAGRVSASYLVWLDS